MRSRMFRSLCALFRGLALFILLGFCSRLIFLSLFFPPLLLLFLSWVFWALPVVQGLHELCRVLSGVLRGLGWVGW